jgi:hypothetical protein
MRQLSILVVLLLTGCSTAVPISAKFPDAPKDLMESCAKLKTIQGETTTLSNFTRTVVENYTLYHECNIKTESWIEWYNIQKKIFEKN